MENISDNITYREATFSNTAIRKGITNSPEPDQLERMKMVANKIFQPCREFFNEALRVNSFFRCITLNKEIGGSNTSDHCSGQAIDFEFYPSSERGNAEIFNYIKENLEFDQLIWEYGNDSNPDWIHASYREGDNRNQVLRVKRIDGKSKYFVI